MHISMISEHASPLAPLGGVDAGGQNVHVGKLASELAQRGHEVTVFTRREDETSPDVVEMEPGVRVVHVSTGADRYIPKDELLDHMPAFGREVARLWSENPEQRPDILHTHFWMSGLAGRTALETAGLDVPLVHTYHALGSVKRRFQGSEDTSPAERTDLETSLGHAADAIIATCQDEVSELAALGIDTTKVSVVPCGVDTEEFRPAEWTTGSASLPTAVAAPWPCTRRKRIVSLGRLVPRKGVDLVIRGLARLAARGIDDVDLEIIGGSGTGGSIETDPEVERLSALAAQLGVEDRVRFRGQLGRDEIPEVIRSATLVACTPWYEPFGIVPLEAMACGVPVVATSVGGLQDTIVDGVTGLLIPPQDVDAFATAAARLITDPEYAQELGRAGIDRVRERFTWPAVAQRTERAYRAVLGQDDDALVSSSLARIQLPAATSSDSVDVLVRHFQGVSSAVNSLAGQISKLRQWGAVLARTLSAGGTLYCAGNGGSAAEAQHLSAELVGKYAADRPPFSAVALSTDTSAVTAISNDYGFEHVFARQVEAHARPGDILILMSTSGRSPNLVRAAETAQRLGVTTWALTGPEPSPLTAACDSSIRIDSASPHVQEAHLMAVHCLCAIFDQTIATMSARSARPATNRAPARSPRHVRSGSL
ncbi:type III pantothenate kinase [Brevibacterium sanguinis]|uniref:Type III pantothenate kinase n=2 Tax=Brevibacterium TaxID=1696 RepID=A0A366IM10_9MICO|nr:MULTISPECIES: glycosyltransferase [Brevibacterium]RBP65442.1 type III pantothenate kinase [Brevibacterium sanguinis]RBP72076.1 type III pantothenate kinase [Brevibacterium celere]